MFAISTCGFCFVHFCYAEVALPELLKSLTSQFSRALLARRNLCTAASRASGLAAKIMMKYKVQFSVYLYSVVYLCAYGYTLNILYMIWYSALPCMHESVQLTIALAYVLMYYYGNTASH